MYEFIDGGCIFMWQQLDNRRGMLLSGKAGLLIIEGSCYQVTPA
jgi:hypothetical protein